MTDIAFGGEGVVRVEGFVFFVPFVAAGERIEFQATEVRKQFGRGHALRILEASPDRVMPQCPYYGACGGCQYQHLRYEEQLRLKHRQVVELFQRIGHLDPARIAPIEPCPSPYHYRNRVMIRSQWDKHRQAVNLGFLRRDDRLVVDIEDCRIAEPDVGAQIRQARSEPPPRGGMKRVFRRLPDGWDVPRDAFFQNNSILLPRLVEVARERRRLSGGRFLVDAYCGVGLFSVELGAEVERFAGVDLDRPAIQAARNNAAARGLAHGEFVVGAAETVLPDWMRRWPPAETTLILDPPRTGCHAAMLRALRDEGPGQVLYISCHPATLARDLNVLCNDGVYSLERAVPLDMFPQTQHVECVVDLRARNG